MNHVFPIPGIHEAPYGEWGMMPHMWNMMGPGMFLMGVVWLLLIALLVLAGIWLFRNLTQTGPPRADDPLEILKRRYAKGEISKEEFDRMRQDIA